jgi:hypothetical protein
MEGRMSKFAIRFLTLAICATPLVVVPVTTAKAETSSGKHIKKHHRNMPRSPGFGDPWSAGQAPPSTRPSGQSGERPAQATPEASIAGRGLPRWMRILIEKRQALMAAKRT